jgi:peptidyl-prolyl cis-trans isomerase B (cyclophilin B)
MSTQVDLQTSKGTIRIELDDAKAPLSSRNFLAYVDAGHYNGTVFHRVIPSFMIQGGGFEPGMKQKPTQAPINNEANNGLKNDHYTLAMARTSAPHSATAQFFINTTDNGFLNFKSESPQGWGYAVFGKVVSGQDVVDAIEKVATGSRGGHGDVPTEDVVISPRRRSRTSWSRRPAGGRSTSSATCTSPTTRRAASTPGGVICSGRRPTPC